MASPRATGNVLRQAWLRVAHLDRALGSVLIVWGATGTALAVGGQRAPILAGWMVALGALYLLRVVVELADLQHARTLCTWCAREWPRTGGQQADRWVARVLLWLHHRAGWTRALVTAAAVALAVAAAQARDLKYLVHAIDVLALHCGAVENVVANAHRPLQDWCTSCRAAARGSVDGDVLANAPPPAPG